METPTASYRDLEIYREAHALGVEVHRLLLTLPKHAMFELGSQLRRSSKSVSANIVEGYGRRIYKADFLKFLIYAQASCDETREWLQYICDCYEESSQTSQQLIQKTEILGRKLSRFIAAVNANHRTPDAPSRRTKS